MMFKRNSLLWMIVVSIVVIVMIGVVLLLNLTPQNAIDLINSPAGNFIPEHLEDYEKVIFKVMMKEMDRFTPTVTPEILEKEGVVSIIHGTINEETSSLFETFVANSSDGKAAQIIIAVYTAEGYPIYMNILFDRVQYFAVIDKNNDGFNGKDEDYENLRYDYLKIFTNPETGSYFVILTDDSKLTFDQLRIAQIGSNMERIDSFQLFSYSK